VPSLISDITVLLLYDVCAWIRIDSRKSLGLSSVPRRKYKQGACVCCLCSRRSVNWPLLWFDAETNPFWCILSIYIYRPTYTHRTARIWQYARLEVLTTMLMTFRALWGMTPYSLVLRYQQFGGTSCLQLQGSPKKKRWRQHAPRKCWQAYLYPRDAQIFQNCKSHIKILCARHVTRSRVSHRKKKIISQKKRIVIINCNILFVTYDMETYFK